MLSDAVDQSPAYLAIADRLRLLICDGRIPPETRLPSERALTDALGLSRTTVSRAYAELKDRGYLAARQGSGSVTQLPQATATSDVLLDPGPGDPSLVDLTCAAPLAPAGVTQAYRWAVEHLPSYLPQAGYYPSGVPALREAIADRYTERGLPTSPDQVLVTTGALSALAVAVRAHVDPGDRVLLESPTYPNAIGTLRGAGARLTAADIHQSGWGAASLVETVAQTRPAAAYLMPDFQNPTGQLMGDEQRAGLAAALRRAKVLTIVDETLAETNLDVEELPLPFAAHLPSTITVGSASKTFWGGLRVGWIRAPQERVAELVAARLTLDLGAPVLEQLALLHLMGDRDSVGEVHRQRLRDSRAALVAALATTLPSWCFRVPAGGMSLWCELPVGASTALAQAAPAYGVRVAPGRVFAPEGGLERRVRLPYTMPADALTTAVGRLATAWEAVVAGGRPARRSPQPALVTRLVT